MPRVVLSDAFIEQLVPCGRQVEYYDSEFSENGSFGIRIGSGRRRSFFYMYSCNGRRKRMTLGGYPQMAVAEAREKASMMARESAEGRDPASLQRHFRLSYRFRDLCESFLLLHAANHCSENTRKEYRRIIERELVVIWGDRDIRCIRTEDIQQTLSLIATQRGAEVLANRVRSLLNRVFRFGMEQGLLVSNPVQQTKERELAPAQPEILELFELSELWRTASGFRDEQSNAFCFLLLYGQNPSELREFRWADIRLEQWSVEKKAGRRTLHLTPPALEILRQQRELNPQSDYVFSPRAHTDLRRHAKRMAQMAHIRSDFSLAWIRRTMLYRLPAEGVSHPATDFILGRMTSLKNHRVDTARVEKEAKRAIELWTRILIPKKPGTSPPGANVVPLFGD